MSMIGKTLGNFTLEARIGKGGMGEVYKAKDQKLGRDVAIKVLPEEFAKDADRVARFQREAKLLASLNHPNIAAIYGLEESDGTHFLVLELIEGDTLADRIKSGQIPVEESLKLALQIAEALEAAHEKGVIHRDLKPANIKVTPDGKVKVLDFGLAKAFAGEHAEVNLSHSPTLSEVATMQGVILGTAAYMSPEQARGKPVDKRTDIWAFGCVLYEMLTGKAAFQGEDVTEILAAVVKSGVNLDILPASIHPRVREVITHCLQKGLKDRYRDIGDAQFEVKQVLADPSGVLVQPTAAAKPRKKMRVGIPWVVGAIVVVSIIVGMAVWNLKPTPPQEPRQVMRFTYELPEGQQFGDLSSSALAVSPDGSKFVYSTDAGLYLRSVNETDSRLLPGTGGNFQQPFFSPDSKWIGFFSSADNKLKKIAISGGAAVTLADSAGVAGSADWQADDTIVYSQIGEGILRISANGGTPEQIIEPAENVFSFTHPQILPDEESVLFTSLTLPQETIMVRSLKSGELKELFEGNGAKYLPTGHIMYGSGNSLFAVRFDINALKVIGGPVPVVESVFSINGSQYAVSDSGTLVYIPGTANSTTTSILRTLIWVDRNGKEEPLAAQPNAYVSPRISPDGTKVAMSINTGGANADIWVWDILRETPTRLTFNEGSNSPLWSLDGKRVVFSSSVAPPNIAVYWKASDGTGVDEKLGSELNLAPSSWSKDGKTLVVAKFPSYDIGIMSMEGDHEWKPLLQEEYDEDQPQISPDGQWMAYVSNESGENEIYVRPFPDVDKGRWQISTAGGDSPLWSPDGRELFYRNGDEVMAVAVETKPTFSRGKPETLFSGTYASFSSQESHPWDISSDGKRFLMMKESGTEASRKINIVLNWFEELKERVPID